MKDEQELENKLNAKKNGGAQIHFDADVDQHEEDAPEGSEAEGKKKKPEEDEEKDPKEGTPGVGSKKKPGNKEEDDDDDADDVIEIASNPNGTSITASIHKSKDFFEVMHSEYESDHELNKALLSRTKENIKLVRASMKRAENRNEVNDKIHDVCKEIESIVNDEARRSKYQDNGMAKALAVAFEPYTELGYALLSYTPTHLADDQFSIETRDLFQSVSDALQRIATARTSSERILLLMTLGSQYRTLFQSHTMISGQANFVNGRGHTEWNERTFDDLWAYYLYDVEFNDLQQTNGSQTQSADESTIEDAGRKFIGQVGDNVQQPDITIVKPFFPLFVDDKLLYDLRKLNISEEALSVLGNYSLPTELWGGSTAQETWEPEHEDYTRSKIHVKAGDMVKTYADAIGNNFSNVTFQKKRPDFEWSHNGTLNLISNTPAKMVNRNTTFVKEVSALIDLATSMSAVEISRDVAFFIVLTNWLNGIYKYMIDINSSYMEVVEKGVKANAERFISPFTQDLILETLTKFSPEDDAKEADSIIDTLFRKINLEYDRSVSAGYTYSMTAYNIMKDEFQSVSYLVNGEDEFYIGKVKIGNNSILVNIVQKLYLPVDLTMTAEELSDLNVMTGFMSTTFGAQMIKIENPYLFATSVMSWKFNKRRGASESGLLTNVSLFHLMMQVSSKGWNDILDDFYSTQCYTYDGRRICLSELFALQPDKANTTPLPNIRTFNPLTPLYKRASYLHLNKLSFKAPAVEDNHYELDEMWVYPLLDQGFNITPGMFANYDNTNLYFGCGLGWIIQALVNEHADFSWILQSIFLIYIKTKLSIKLCEDAGLRDTNGYCLPSLPWSISLSGGITVKSSNFDTPKQGAQAAAFPVIPYSTYARRRGFTLTKIGYEVDYIDSAFDIISVAAPKTAASTNDVIKAFRFVPYCHVNYDPLLGTSTNINYLIDNKFVDAGKTCPKTIYYNVADPDNAGYTRISDYRRIIREDEAINITEDEIKQQVINPEFLNEGLLIFDDYHVDNNYSGNADCHEPAYNQTSDNTPLAHAPVAIPNTTMVGYRVNDGIAKIFPHMAQVGHSEPLCDNRLNMYCYIPDDFYPCCVMMSNIIPFATNRSAAVIHPIANGVRNSFNNLFAYDIIANAFHKIGYDKFDYASTHSMLAALTGIDPAFEVWELEGLIRDTDKLYTIDDNGLGSPKALQGYGWFGRVKDNATLHSTKTDISGSTTYPVIIKCGTLPPRMLTGLISGQAQSLRSSLRYPKMFVAPSTVQLTGLPIFKENRQINEYYQNSKKAIKFFEHFHSIVPDQYTELYAAPTSDNISFYNIELQGNVIYSGTHNDQLITSFTIKQILIAMGLFFNLR